MNIHIHFCVVEVLHKYQWFINNAIFTQCLNTDTLVKLNELAVTELFSVFPFSECEILLENLNYRDSVTCLS